MGEVKFIDRVAKGNEAEGYMNLWLQENGIGFFGINQSPESFANFFVDRIKRPDYFVLLQSIGILAVDTKNCELYQGSFPLGINEINKAMAFERDTRIAFWFAYLHRSENRDCWYWISALSARSVGTVKTNGKTGDDFMSIGLQHFIPIRTRHDFGLLYTSQYQSSEGGLSVCS
ncbi:MAG: hypothetical protein PHI06_07595 [Desulfobulbaceae bacterium]|nr:hypothetical protein [Desulfobulbaceae bacterium]